MYFEAPGKGKGRIAFPFFSVISALLFFCLAPKSFAQSPLSGFNPASLSGMYDGAFLGGTTFWGNTALPLDAIFFDNWDGPFNPDDRNNLDVYWKIDTGITYHGWRFAGFYRGELFMESNKDTLEILRMIKLEQALPVGKSFEIDLKGRGFSAKGIEISKGINLSSIVEGFSAGITARHLVGERVQEGKIKGIVTATGAQTYDFDLALDYIYDKNLIYDRRNTNPGYGEGYSFDLGLKYLFLRERLSAEVLFRDIHGRIYWKNIPYTTANATSEVKSFDENGYQVYRPTIKGYEGYRDFTQEIPLKTDIVLSYKEGPFTVSPAINFIEDRPLYWIDLGYRLSEQTSFSTGYNTNYRTFTAGISYKKAMLDIYSSDVDLSRTNAIGLRFALKYEW